MYMKHSEPLHPMTMRVPISQHAHWHNVAMSRGVSITMLVVEAMKAAHGVAPATEDPRQVKLPLGGPRVKRVKVKGATVKRAAKRSAKVGRR